MQLTKKYISYIWDMPKGGGIVTAGTGGWLVVVGKVCAGAGEG